MTLPLDIGLIYGTCTGNTQVVAELIRDEFKPDIISCRDVIGLTVEDIASYDALIIGCPTWDVGELQYDWEDLYENLSDANLRGIQTVFFGLGDQAAYTDTYQDAMGMLHERFAQAGARIGAGYTDSSDQDFEASRALIDGKFCGLAIDQEGQPEMTEPRIKAWVKQLRIELKRPVGV